MSGLDIFALIVLITLIVCFLALWALLGMYPGKIARQRNHPQADAISVCGWWGAITMGVLTPIAFVWAYTNPAATLTGREKPAMSDQEPDEVDQAGEEQS
jgi:fatty acid desaturase